MESITEKTLYNSRAIHLEKKEEEEEYLMVKQFKINEHTGSLHFFL